MHNIIALPSFVFGFHGCDRRVAEKVLSGNEYLKPSENDYDWLGRGIYFWEHNPARALEWANELKSIGRIKHPCALGAIIDLGNCLNLLDSSGLRILKEGYRLLLEAAERLGTPIPQNKNAKGTKDLLLRNLDCAVINLIPEFETVRAVFVEGEPLYHNAGFHEKNHIQICVRKPAAIKAYFRIFTKDQCPCKNSHSTSCDDCGMICLD